ncbi:formate dehydrogenase (NAD+) [Saitozyma podzolica]|uniref:Formate dehydrogenase (NAD+) n=1 Tax=Saitozyma podzolica TaxID=1890683 RepID=A0A427XPQ9_9TREE|nr:formate dehydrogenase (NAD+) [Saitozyma podzolica]
MAVLYKGGKATAAEEEPSLLETVENNLGITDWLRDEGHDCGHESFFQRNIADTDVLITTPFHPAYLTAELFAKAKNLKLCAICVAEDVADALASGQLIGYPARAKGPPLAHYENPRVRTTLFAVNVMILRFDRRVGGGNGILPHMSGTTLDLQYRHAVGTQEILRRWVAGQKQEPQNLIVKNGELGF